MNHNKLRRRVIEWLKEYDRKSEETFSMETPLEVEAQELLAELLEILDE